MDKSEILSMLFGIIQEVRFIMKLVKVLKISTLLLMSLPLCLSQRNIAFIVSASNHNSTAGTTVGITIGTTALGTAGYFLYRYIKRDRIHGDSIIAFVNKIRDSSKTAFKKDDYLLCQENLQHILLKWDQYEKYRIKRKLSAVMTRDSIAAQVAYCQLLFDLRDTVSRFDSLMFSLPNSEDELLKANRHKVLSVEKIVHDGITRIEEVNSHQTDAIHHGFRNSLQRISRLDSLYKAVYASARLEFNMKCKFNFNRAVESRDTVIIRQFVNDCEYYDIKKEWCQRAKDILLSPSVLNVPIKKAIVTERKPSPRLKRKG